MRTICQIWRSLSSVAF